MLTKTLDIDWISNKPHYLLALRFPKESRNVGEAGVLALGSASLNAPIAPRTSIPKIGDNFELPLYGTAIA